MALQACMHAGCPAELVSLLLRAGAALDRSHLSSLANRAASTDLDTVLELLLEAGAVISTALVSSTVEALACSCLAVLLRRGPLPVDTSNPIPRMYDWQGFDYRCPVLHVMQRSKNARYLDRRGLRMLEMLLAAGHRPMVYRNVILPPATQPVAVFDPLNEQPLDFASLDGPGRWMWLALEPEGWTPASHHKHPPLLKDAFWAVRLAAARGRRGSAAQVPDPARAAQKRQRPVARKASAGGRASGPCSAAYLSMLPPDLLLHVLHLATRPLADWLEEK